MKKIPKIWLFIAFYITAIYLTLPLMRSILNFLYSSIGKQSIGIMVNVSLGIAIGITIFLTNKKGVSRTLLAAVPLAAALMFIYTLERPEERVHFLEYGVLGVLVLKGVKERKWRMSLAMAFVFTVGAIDECIQLLLPNRVGDLRDVAMNAIGGTLGIWTGKSLR